MTHLDDLIPLAAAGSAGAAVQIVTLPSPVGFPTVTTGVNLGTAVASVTSQHFKWRAFGADNPGNNISTLVAGSVAGNGSEFFTSRLFGYNQTISNAATGGSWVNGGSMGNLALDSKGYFAFRLPNNGGYTYGWIEWINTNGIFSVARWAYEDTLNQGITTPAAASAVPGGAGLAALAIGAAGLRGRRRGRN